MLGKKQIWVVSYLSSNWVIKLWRQFGTLRTHLAQQLLMNVQCSGHSRSFAKETRALKMRKPVASHWKLTVTNWEHHGSWSTYNYTRSCPRIQCWSFCGHLAFEANWKGEKVRKVGASWADYKSKKSSFWSVVFSYSAQQQWTISWPDCDLQQKVDFILQPATISSVVMYQKKGHGHCLVACCRSHPLQLSESQRNHYIWEVSSANQWDALKTAVPAAGVGQQKGPSSLWQCLTVHHTTSSSKVEWIGLRGFASSAIFTEPPTNWLPLL